MGIHGSGRHQPYPLLQKDIRNQVFTQACFSMVPPLPMSSRRRQTKQHSNSGVHLERGAREIGGNCRPTSFECSTVLEVLAGPASIPDRRGTRNTPKCIVSQARKLCKDCKQCQKYKKRNTKYGHLPAKEAETLEPWHTVCVDLVGTYTVKANVRQLDGSIKVCELKLLAMTFIDPATGWFEIAEVPLIDQSSARTSQLFDRVWLARHPRPRRVICDNGSEFKKNFQPLLKDLAIKPICTSVKNPQSNAILERIHQVTGNMLKNLMNVKFDVIDPWSSILASIDYAVRCSFHSTLKATPGQLVFGRDMLLDLKFEPNYEQTWAQKQQSTNYDNIRENSKRVTHDYKVGDYVYVLRDGNYRKLEGDKQGPYAVTEVFTNGTVRIQKGIVNERINIRRLTPHFGNSP